MSLFTEKYTILTALTQEEILRRISENTDVIQGDYNKYSYRNSTKLYGGKMPGDKFGLKKYQIYRLGWKQFRLVITANITPGNKSTQIKIRIRLPLLTTVFLIAWLWAVGSGLFINIFNSGNHLSNISSSDTLQLLIMFSLGLLFSFLFFNQQVNDSKEFLESILEGQAI